VSLAGHLPQPSHCGKIKQLAPQQHEIWCWSCSGQCRAASVLCSRPGPCSLMAWLSTAQAPAWEISSHSLGGVPGPHHCAQVTD
jgi:hypothetical protein